jgi:hypothetical protein
MHHSENYAADLSTGLKNLLGADWRLKLHLISYEGTPNPEKILPAVILFNIPMGLRGLLIVALLAASMSTFDSYLNMTTGFFTRDIYQRYLRTGAKNNELIYISYIYGVVVVCMSFAFAYTIESLNDAWAWLTMGLGAGLLIPRFVRFYWWRFNGSGFALGMIAGVVCAVVQRILWIGLDERLQFLILASVGLIGAIIGTYLTPPTNSQVLKEFYIKTRPFGFWGPLKRSLHPDSRKAINREHFYDLISLPFVLTWQVTLFLIPMQIVIKDYRSSAVTIGIFLLSVLGMYLFWYRKLPKENAEIIGFKNDGVTLDNG